MWGVTLMPMPEYARKKRVLVCSGRKYSNAEQLDRAMRFTHQWFDPKYCIIEGEAPGADRMAKAWGKGNGVPVLGMEANWDFYDRKAGTLRNTWMLDYTFPDLVIALPGGTGTRNMVKQARERGIDVWEVPIAF